jgi:hypothetical protein
MSSSNILSIHGLKKKHQFQDSNGDINGDYVQGAIMYVVYSIPKRSSDLTVLDVWPVCPISLDALGIEKDFGCGGGVNTPKIIVR